MFLITTAEERSWKQGCEILFLGEWCKLYNRKNIWENLKSQTIPYHWDNRKIFQKDNILLESIYEKYLLIVANELNRIHNTDHSLRYWRIVIGLWLRYFIEILFDRYESINSAKDCYRIDETWIFKYSLSDWVPNEYQEFHKFNLNDKWNHILYAEIIKSLNEIPYEIINKKIYPNKKIERTSTFNAFISNVIIKYNQLIPQKNKEIFFVNTIWPIRYVFSLQLSLNQTPNLFESLVAPIKVAKKSYNKILRDKISLNNANTRFETILERLMPHSLPLSFLECYKQLEKNTEKIYPKRAKIIYTANAYSYDEGFKIWSASQVERGAKLIIGQHGGRPGLRIIQSLFYQIKISDKFISWGWSDSRKVIPLPSVKLSRFKLNLNPDGKVLVLLPSYQKYFYHSTSMPIAGQCLKHFDEQLMVLKYLKEHIINDYRFRLGRRGDAWDIELRLKDSGLGDLIDNRAKSFVNSANKSRLIIHTDHSTSLLETMAANFPSLIFWNPKYYELSDEAKPYFDAFYKIGIMHYDPKSLAKKLNDIYKDTNAWWNQSEIQNVRKEFCNNFALTRNDWLESWEKCFTLLIKS